MRSSRPWLRTPPTGLAVGLALATLCLASSTLVPPASGAGADHLAAFERAAAEYAIPAGLLMAVSYEQSRWESHPGKPSSGGGFGPMHLTGFGPGEHTLDLGAQLTGTPRQALTTDYAANVRAGAAVLAHFAREVGGRPGGSAAAAGQWYGAVARYGAGLDADAGRVFAEDVYGTLRDGQRRLVDGEQLVLPAQPGVRPERERFAAVLGARAASPAPAEEPAWPAECPTDLPCEVIPAVLAKTGPAPNQYGNYWVTERPKEMRVGYVVVHNTEGSYAGTVSWFRNPKAEVSAHYVIRSSDGHVAQMVRLKDTAWQAGNRWVNFHSVGIEHEGYAAQGATWFSERMYRSSAKVMRYLSQRFGFPLDRGRIIGHDTVPAKGSDGIRGMHWDPGPYWDWAHYFELLGRPVVSDGRTPRAGQAVTVTPRFADNRQTVRVCPKNQPCFDQTQPSNFVRLRSEPSPDAPLLADPGLNPGGQGSNAISDWGSKATTSERFVVAEQRGEWTAIWFAGRRAWFHNPGGANTALQRDTLTVTPRAGADSIPVYGMPYPEAAAFKAPVSPIPADVRLTPYSITAGQRYVSYEGWIRSDYIHLTSIDRSQPGDGTVVVGRDRYYPIQFHHRLAFVKASDITLAMS